MQHCRSTSKPYQQYFEPEQRTLIYYKALSLLPLLPLQQGDGPARKPRLQSVSSCLSRWCVLLSEGPSSYAHASSAEAETLSGWQSLLNVGLCSNRRENSPVGRESSKPFQITALHLSPVSPHPAQRSHEEEVMSVQSNFLMADHPTRESDHLV